MTLSAISFEIQLPNRRVRRSQSSDQGADFHGLADAVRGDVRLEIPLREDLEAMEVADEMETATH